MTTRTEYEIQVNTGVYSGRDRWTPTECNPWPTVEAARRELQERAKRHGIAPEHMRVVCRMITEDILP